MISCDPPAGYIDGYGVFQSAEDANVSAVIFYSETAQSCELQNYTGSYNWVFATMSRGDTMQVVESIRSEADSEEYGTIIAQRDAPASGNGGDHHDGWKGKWDDDDQNANPLGPSPSTAVAMIILYSITGLITGLFLLIIVTGAIRAHRHPERYGPRNIMGRPRQSRAKGLARAMLETLPIVKTGERNEPKPADVELAENTNASTHTGEDATTRDASTEPSTKNESQSTPPNETRASIEGGIAAAINNAEQNPEAKQPDYLGCSICTEDFEPGQDQRVLPCDHRFHPACVDPWLLNVSGTCPLCRIDLQPQNSRGSETGEVDENGDPILREGEFDPPPLGPDETPDERQRMSIRRSIIIGLMGIGRPDRMTREERVLALRQLRGQQLARQAREEQARVAETPEERRSTRQRLGAFLRRDMLGLRRVSYSGRQQNASTEQSDARQGQQSGSSQQAESSQQGSDRT